MSYDYHKIKERDEPVRYQKVAICGSERVGKTQLCNLLTNTTPSDAEYTPTIGTNYQEYQNLHLWDMGGAERFQSLWPMYLRGSQQVLLTFNKAHKRSFEDLKEHLATIRKTTPSANIILVSTHESQSASKVSSEEIQGFCVNIVLTPILKFRLTIRRV